MILVVGGLNGFVGSNTTEALVEQGIDCVVTRHKSAEVPGFLQKYLNRNVFIEPADATSIEDLRRIGEKHQIDGIVDVAGGLTPRAKSPVPRLKGYFDMLAGVFQMAEEWSVKRLTLSSTAGVYLGLKGTVKEDQPVSLASPFGLVAHHKIVEVAANEFARGTGISSVCVRLAGMFGPWQDPAGGVLASSLVHAAVQGRPVALDGVFMAGEDEGVDLTYIKDIGRAIARLQTAEKLSHGVYHVGSGKVTPNRELVEAVRATVPGFDVDLPTGRSPFPPMPVMETDRLRADTGFSPAYDLRSAVKDYVAWLHAGNSR